MDRFTSLPSEVFALIIDQISPHDVYTLYKCIFINKHFYRAIMPIIRHTFVFYHKTSRHLPTDWTGTHAIRTLKFKNNSQWSDMEFMTLVNNANLLEECILPFTTRIAKECIQQLPLLCPNFTTLHLGDPFGTQECLSCMRENPNRFCSGVTLPIQYDEMDLDLDGPTLLSDLVMYPSSLEQLSIVHPPPQLMAAMTTHPHISLKCLARFDRLTHLKFYFIATPLLECVFTCTTTLWPALTELHIAGEFADPRRTTLVPFLESHPGLEALYFTHCELWDDTIDAIADLHHPGLSTFMLSDSTHGPGVARSTFLRLIEMTPRLTYVYADGDIIGSRRSASPEKWMPQVDLETSASSGEWLDWVG